MSRGTGEIKLLGAEALLRALADESRKSIEDDEGIGLAGLVSVTEDHALACADEVAALTAEVQRLRGEAGELRALVRLAANCIGEDEDDVADIMRRLAALTPPAADTEGKDAD